MDLEHVERKLRQRLDALGPAPRAELLHVLMLPDFDRAERIGDFWGYPESRSFAELLIDCEKGPDPTGRARGDAAGGRPLGADSPGLGRSESPGRGANLATVWQHTREQIENETGLLRTPLTR
jgi:hypothetical protein